MNEKALVVPAIITKVVDGDTLRVRACIWPDHEVNTLIRVLGVDTPESNHLAKCPQEKELGLRAKEFAKQFLGSAVLLTNIEPDKYGSRFLANVNLPDGNSYATLLIAAGFARPYFGDKKSDWCGGGQS